MTARHALHFIPPSHRRDRVGINQRFLKEASLWFGQDSFFLRSAHMTTGAKTAFTSVAIFWQTINERAYQKSALTTIMVLAYFYVGSCHVVCCDTKHRDYVHPRHCFR